MSPPGTWQNIAHGAACPQLAKADVRSLGKGALPNIPDMPFQCQDAPVLFGEHSRPSTEDSMPGLLKSSSSERSGPDGVGHAFLHRVYLGRVGDALLHV